SDFLDNAGVAGAWGTGTSPSAHKGSIISPRIDVSGYTDSALVVDFYSYYLNYQIGELSISFSVDDGATWSTTDFRTLQPAATNTSAEGFVAVVFPTITAGVTNLTQCRIKFTFDGNYYFSMIDDVSIAVADEYDLTIAIEDAGGTTLAAKYNQLTITNNRHFPLSQMNTHHLMFGANVKNYGHKNVLPTDGATLNVEIQANQSGNWVAVHNQSTNIQDTIKSTNGTAVTDTLNSSSWAQIGDFRARYTTSLSTDNNASNDTVYHLFSINDNSYASKVALRPDNTPAYNRPMFPGGTSFQSFEYGSMFEFSNAVNEALRIDSVSFRYYIPNTYTGATTATVFVTIYKFIDGANGSTLNGFLDDDNELILAGVSTVNLTGLGSTTPNGTSNVGIATGFIDNTSGAPLTNLTDDYYLATLSLVDQSSPFNSTNSIWFGASSINNFSLNLAMSSSGNVISHPSPVKIVDATGTGGWNWIGFGANIVPSIGVHLSGCPITTSNFSVTANECSGYTVPSGDSTYTAVGNYTVNDTINNAAGCDSVMTITITIESLNQTVTATNSTLCSTNTGTTITTGSSETGVNYYLRDNANDTIVDGPMPGTGSPISLNTGNIASTMTFNIFGEKASIGLEFDGSSTEIALLTYVPTFSNNFTYEAWVNPTATHEIDAQANSGADGVTGQNYLIGAAHRSGDGGVGISVGTNGVSVYEHGSNYMPALLVWTGTISTWTHIAVVYTAKQPTLYVNGTLVATGLTSLKANVYPSLGITPNGVNNGIGGGDYGYYSGQVDDFRLWDVSRTPAEIQSSMNSCLTGAEANLYALYDFEDGTGSSTLTDLTANSNDGTLTNMDPATDWIVGTGSCSGCSLEMTSTATVTVLPALTGTDTRTECNSYTWIDGNTYTANNSSATFNIANGAANSCDSLVTLDLTINTVDTSITNNSPTLTANATGATYQWLDCNNNMSVIPGATNASYTVTVNGSYAVVVTQNGCTDTSACIPVTVTGVNNDQLSVDNYKIYPNPSKGIFTVSLDQLDDNSSIIVYSAVGAV
ncbi:MAG: LamG domain-containing protein, partial [Flavobacteriales bacterium]|nr:LamG domain-containing protein [Flavobacteriales bacterium]